MAAAKATPMHIGSFSGISQPDVSTFQECVLEATGYREHNRTPPRKGRR
jgi:hypothetical protein